MATRNTEEKLIRAILFLLPSSPEDILNVEAAAAPQDLEGVTKSWNKNKPTLFFLIKK
jgi:hypothetical protein